MAAFQLLNSSCNLRCIAAGILHIVEASGGKAPVQNFRCYQTLIGIGTFVKAQLGILGKHREQFFCVGDKYIVAFIVDIQPVGDEDQCISAGFVDGIELLGLVFQSVGNMAGGDHQKIGVQSLCPLINPAVQFHSFFQRQVEDLTGLTDGKNAGQTVFIIPVHIFTGGIVVDRAIGFVRGDHCC